MATPSPLQALALAPALVQRAALLTMAMRQMLQALPSAVYPGASYLGLLLPHSVAHPILPPAPMTDRDTMLNMAFL